MRNAHKNLIWKPEGKRPFGRPTHRWADIINIKGMGHEDADCIKWIRIKSNSMLL
jgi:hypothetical protein